MLPRLTGVRYDRSVSSRAPGTERLHLPRGPRRIGVMVTD